MRTFSRLQLLLILLAQLLPGSLAATCFSGNKFPKFLQTHQGGDDDAIYAMVSHEASQ